MTDKEKEQKWVDENLTGRSRYWQDLLESGRLSLNTLDDGDLKYLLNLYLTIQRKVTDKLEKEYGYYGG